MADLPRYVMQDKDRHGTVRYYFRRAGRKVRLRAEPGTEAFTAQLETAAGPGAALNFDGRKYSLSVVYFISHGNKRVKIGTTTNVDRRYQAIRHGVPGRCAIQYVTPGGTELERELHRLFAEDRVSGEWFIYSMAIRDWIGEDKERRLNERGGAKIERLVPHHAAPPFIKVVK